MPVSCQDDWRGCASPRSPRLWSLHPTEGLLRSAPVPGSVFRQVTCRWLPAEAKQEPGLPSTYAWTWSILSLGGDSRPRGDTCGRLASPGVQTWGHRQARKDSFPRQGTRPGVSPPTSPRAVLMGPLTLHVRTPASDVASGFGGAQPDPAGSPVIRSMCP